MLGVCLLIIGFAMYINNIPALKEIDVGIDINTTEMSNFSNEYSDLRTKIILNIVYLSINVVFLLLGMLFLYVDI